MYLGTNGGYEYEKETPILIETINDIKDNSVGLSALVTFVGLYLGIIFLISSAVALREDFSS